MALAEPMPKSQLFWMGTLMRLATGFDSFLASSAAAAFSSVAASCANSVAMLNTSAQASVRRMSFGVIWYYCLLVTVHWSLVVQSVCQVVQELQGDEEAIGLLGCSALATASRSARLATGLRR